MDNGTYQAKKDCTIIGIFSMADVIEGQMIGVLDGDHDDTAFIECGPFNSVEVNRNDNFSDFEFVE
jgi:hypothetical protein